MSQGWPSWPAVAYPTWARPFASGSNRARWAVQLQIALVAFSALTVLVLLGLAWLTLDVMSQAAEPTIPAQDQDLSIQLGGYQLMIWLTDLLAMPVWAGWVVAYCLWLHRAYRNLPALGANELRASPGWTVGSVFIPFVQLVLPWLSMIEIWKGSDPRVWQAGRAVRRALPISPLLILWWILSLLSLPVSALSLVILNVLRYQDAAVMILVQCAWLVVVKAIDMAIGVFAALTIRAVDARQEEKAKQVAMATQVEASPAPYVISEGLT